MICKYLYRAVRLSVGPAFFSGLDGERIYLHLKDKAGKGLIGFMAGSAGIFRKADAFAPRAVLIENVPGLVSFEHGAALHAILDALGNAHAIKWHHLS